jgi:hypothetical protein
VRLRSIPLANRSRGSLARLSSMRAATRVGLIMVGSGQHAGGPVREPEFRPKVIAPNRERQAMRAALAEALLERRQFWEEELATWAGEFGEDAVRGIIEMMEVRG